MLDHGISRMIVEVPFSSLLSLACLGHHCRDAQSIFVTAEECPDTLLHKHDMIFPPSTSGSATWLLLNTIGILTRYH